MVRRQRHTGGLSGRFGGVKTYFVAQFGAVGPRFTSHGVWDLASSQLSPGSASINGTHVGAWIGFDSGAVSTVVEMYIGLSFVSLDNARLNLKTELWNGKLSFDLALNQTQSEWEGLLGRFEVTGGDEVELVKFYTAAYHAFLAPTTFNDVNGQYLGFDSRVHLMPAGRSWYSDMSIWDTHRTQFPLLALVLPDVMSDIVNSLVLMFQQGGDLPRWPMANGYTGTMSATHADVVVADGYLKGVRGFDVDQAMKALIQSATQPQRYAGRENIDEWLKYGYVSYASNHKAAILTLEYAFDDWAVGNMAAALNNSAAAELFYNRSKNYRNVWNAEKQFFCPKSRDPSSGAVAWACPPWYDYLNPFDTRYEEGDAWHWRWFVPHDPTGLIALFGGVDKFVEQLMEFFDYSNLDQFNILPNPYYWAGNEPDIFAAWLFTFAGRPDLTQKYTRMVMSTRYSGLPDGLPGNDDYGTMSAWYMFAALGFYPQAGSTTYILGSPVFPQAVVHLANNTRLVITAHNANADNIYVQKVAVNGRPWPSWFIDHAQLVGGTNNGTASLEFWMGPTASATA